MPRNRSTPPARTPRSAHSLVSTSGTPRSARALMVQRATAANDPRTRLDLGLRMAVSPPFVSLCGMSLRELPARGGDYPECVAVWKVGAVLGGLRKMNSICSNPPTQLHQNRLQAYGC